MDKIFKRLNFVITECDNTSKNFDKTEREEIMLFCMCMLDRLNLASYSLKILMERFSSNTKVEYSCGIIIRSVLLDYLIVLNAMDIYGKNLNDTAKWHQEMKAYCLMMLSDSVKNTLSYFDTLKTKVPPEVMNKMYANLVASSPECFEPNNVDGGVPVLKTKDHRSPKTLFKTLLESKELKQYASAYEAYLYYSKYDHFGQMFYSLSRLSYLDRLALIDQALSVFPRSLMFTVTILLAIYPTDALLKDQFEKISQFIDDIEGIKKTND